jgi:hypothetical protein
MAKLKVRAIHNDTKIPYKSTKFFPCLLYDLGAEKKKDDLLRWVTNRKTNCYFFYNRFEGVEIFSKNEFGFDSFGRERRPDYFKNCTGIKFEASIRGMRSLIKYIFTEKLEDIR